MADKEKNAGQEAAVKKANKAASADSKKSGKNKKGDKEKKGFFSRIAGWFKDLKKEFKKVVWPDRKESFQQHAGRSRCCCHRFCAGRLIDSGLLKLMQFLMGLSN